MENLITTYATLLQSYSPERVHATMVRHGHGKLWRRTLRKAERLATKEIARTEPVLTLACASDAQKQAEAIAHVHTSTARTRIDPTIVGGFILKKGFTRIDRSYKTALINLYKKVIA